MRYRRMCQGYLVKKSKMGIIEVMLYNFHFRYRERAYRKEKLCFKA